MIHILVRRKLSGNTDDFCCKRKLHNISLRIQKERKPQLIVPARTSEILQEKVQYSANNSGLKCIFLQHETCHIFIYGHGHGHGHTCTIQFRDIYMSFSTLNIVNHLAVYRVTLLLRATHSLT